LVVLALPHLFVLSLFAEFLANDRPILVQYKGEWLTPIFVDYPEEKFGGFLARTDYRDPTIAKEINQNGRMIWPPIRFSYATHNLDLPVPAPAAADLELSDEQCRPDRRAHGRHGLPRYRVELARHRRPGPRRRRATDLRLRILVLFGLILAIISS
jgi:microcin C transport system permease protein